jgi:hypothetical protein
MEEEVPEAFPTALKHSMEICSSSGTCLFARRFFSICSSAPKYITKSGVGMWLAII